LALSGAAINAADALLTGAAHWALPDASRHALIEQLTTLAWSGQPSDHTLLSDFLQQQAPAPLLVASHLAPHLALLQDCHGSSLLETLSRLGDLAESNDPWLAHAVARIKKASPTSLWLAWTLQMQCRELSFAETVELETQVSAACLRYGDFTAGIYATLFDRSSAPRWQQEHIADLDQMQLRAAFPMLF
jgi:enoyl-CoA hydratase